MHFIFNSQLFDDQKPLFSYLFLYSKPINASVNFVLYSLPSKLLMLSIKNQPNFEIGIFDR